MKYIKIDSPRYLYEKDKIHAEKKKSIDLHSTNASNKLLINLSNPTNLTNPFIIAKSKRYDDSKENSFLSNREYKINKLNQYNKLIFRNNSKKLKTSKSELNLLNEGIKGPVIKINNNKKLLKSLDTRRHINKIDSRNLIFFPKSNKSCKNEINYISQLSIHYDEAKNNMKKAENNSDKKEDNEEIKHKKLELDPIWEKLKNSKLFNPIDKDIRVETTKFIKKFDYLDKKRQISVIKHDMNIKNDRYNKIINMNSNEINTIEKMINNVTKISDNIQKNYYDNYVSNIINLSLQVEKEKIKSSNFMLEQNSLRKENSKLEKKINKLKEERNNILRWIYLQIKIKEKRIILPEYYKDIIENKNSYEAIVKKYKLKENVFNEIKYNKIKEYRDKLVFNNIDELKEIFYSLENKLFYDLNKKLDKNNDIKQLKNDLENNIKIEKEIEQKENGKKESNKNVKMTFEEKEKYFIKELKKLKFKNNELNEEYSKIKHFKLLFNNITNNDRYLDNNKNEVDKNRPTLFSISMRLYQELIKANFNIKNKIKWKYNVTEERIILDIFYMIFYQILKKLYINQATILRFTEKIMNYLSEEKLFYYSDDKMKMKYKLISDEIEKEAKNKKLIKQLELQEQLLTARKEKIQQRLNNRNYFKPYRKVDFEYYLKQKVKNKNKNIRNERKDDNYYQNLFY